MKQELISNADVSIWRLPVGQMRANCYLLTDKSSQKTIIIDPGDDAQYIIETIVSMNLSAQAIVATHGHFDHVMAGFEVQKTFNIPLYMHPADQFLLDRMGETAEHFLGITVVEPAPTRDRDLAAGQTLSVGNLTLQIMETPGHTPGSVCVDIAGKHILFTGDTIFVQGGVGRTDFSYSDKESIHASLTRILTLPSDTILLPGHGEETTVGKEKVFHSL